MWCLGLDVFVCLIRNWRKTKVRNNRKRIRNIRYFDTLDTPFTWNFSSSNRYVRALSLPSFYQDRQSFWQLWIKRSTSWRTYKSVSFIFEEIEMKRWVIFWRFEWIRMETTLRKCNYSISIATQRTIWNILEREEPVRNIPTRVQRSFSEGC